MQGLVIRPGESRLFLGLVLTAANADAWNAFDRVRLDELSFRACYCSVFHECWITTLRDLHLSQKNPARSRRSDIRSDRRLGQVHFADVGRDAAM